MNLDVLRKVPLFASLNTDQLRRVAAICTEREVPSGEVIFREGDPGEEMFVVLEGRARISQHMPTGGEEALAILEPGAYFGEMALVDDAPRSAAAHAHTRLHLAVLRKTDLDQLLFVDRDLAYELLWTFVRTLSIRLRETNEKIKVFFTLSQFG